MPDRVQKPMRKIREKYILNPVPVVEVEPQDEFCHEDRIPPAEPKPAFRKRQRSSSSLQQHQPYAKKQKVVAGKTKCTQCDREFDDCEFRRHNKIEHNLHCDKCSLMFVDVTSFLQHFKSHHENQERENPRRQSQHRSKKKQNPPVECLKDNSRKNSSAGLSTQQIHDGENPRC